MSDELDDTTELYPAWRQALLLFRQSNFNADEIVPHSWFYEALSIAMPEETTPLKVAERLKLQWLTQFTRLKQSLLEQHNIDLVSEPGLGYRIMPPSEQSKQALEDGATAMKKAVRSMVDRSTYVNTALLSADERRQHTDNLARIGAFSTMFRRARTLPSMDEE